MSCQRCIREFLPRQPLPRWKVSIHAKVRHGLNRQATSAYTTLSSRKSIICSSAMRDTPSTLLRHSSEALGSIIEPIIVQTQQVEITSLTSNVPLVSPPRQPCHSRNHFFQYMDQRTLSNTPVTMHYTKSTVQANWLVSQIKGKVVGMDLEWRPQGKTNVSLIQICDENLILLIHICNMKGLVPRRFVIDV